MAAHTYTLLSDLKIITTGVLSYLLLNRQLNRRAAASLVLLFAGICLGQYGTSNDNSNTAAASTPVAAAAAGGPLGWLHGVLVMALVAVLSALAAVYTEWVMNHSTAYKHESINLQNMRLYASGTLFNGLYSITRTAAALSSFGDMRPTHWLIVLGLAFMGLVTVRGGEQAAATIKTQTLNPLGPSWRGDVMPLANLPVASSLEVQVSSSGVK